MRFTMHIVRIYQSFLCPPLQEMDLSPEASLHVGQVLRMKPGDKLTLFCGTPYEYEAVICSVHKKKVRVLVQEEKKEDRESPKAIHLIQGISRGDRMELVVQKAVELGVKRITPVITEHCALRIDKERLEKKWKQWQGITISACEQCGRNQIPAIDAPRSLMDYLAEKSGFEHFVLDPTGQKTWRDYPLHGEGFSLLVGPEGGLSLREIEILEKEHFARLSLGPRILRTETAALAALTLFQALVGDL